jgi:hypothetical protein
MLQFDISASYAAYFVILFSDVTLVEAVSFVNLTDRSKTCSCFCTSRSKFACRAHETLRDNVDVLPTSFCSI